MKEPLKFSVWLQMNYKPLPWQITLAEHLEAGGDVSMMRTGRLTGRSWLLCRMAEYLDTIKKETNQGAV